MLFQSRTPTESHEKQIDSKLYQESSMPFVNIKPINLNARQSNNYYSAAVFIKGKRAKETMVESECRGKILIKVEE